MRYSSDHKAQTHQRIIKEASVRFRRDGIGATGLQPLMKALNLTHGGFYAHFKSKDELVEKALQAAAAELDAHCEMLFSQERPLEGFIDSYLSEWHLTSPDQGCRRIGPGQECRRPTIGEADHGRGARKLEDTESAGERGRSMIDLLRLS